MYSKYHFEQYARYRGIVWAIIVLFVSVCCLVAFETLNASAETRPGGLVRPILVSSMCICAHMDWFIL